MRRILIGLTLALLLVVSIGVTDGSSAPARGRKNRVAQRLGASIIDHL